MGRRKRWTIRYLTSREERNDDVLQGRRSIISLAFNKRKDLDRHFRWGIWFCISVQRYGKKRSQTTVKKSDHRGIKLAWLQGKFSTGILGHSFREGII